MRRKVEFETMKAEFVDLGNGKFLEIARKKAKTEDGENEFVSISRGFVLPNGEKRYLKSFTLPKEKDMLEKISSLLMEV